MIVNKDQLKLISAWQSKLSDECIDVIVENGCIDEEGDKLPEEVEIDEIVLSFPDDIEYTRIPTEDFFAYMSELGSMRCIGNCIVRTDHIIQAVISSTRMGYTSFENLLCASRFKGEGVDVSVVKNPFLVGVFNARKGNYEEDFGIGACEPYTALEIRLDGLMDDISIKKLIDQVCFYLTDIFDIAIYPWEGVDVDKMYEHMDEYYSDDGQIKEEERQIRSVDIVSLPRYSPLLRMFRQAKGVDDPEIMFLHYYKIIEYISPVVARRVAYEQLNKRLDMLPAVKRNYEYLDSIISVTKKYYKDLRDDSLAQSVIESCVDVLPLYELMPERLRRQIKASLKLQKDDLTNDDLSEEQLRGLQRMIASIVYSTRNSIVHAKSNYVVTGNEIKEEELSEGNKVMEVIARAIINWDQRQPEGFSA